MEPSLPAQKAEDKLMELRKATSRNISRPSSTEWLDRGSAGLVRLPNAGLGIRRKSFADILQEGLDPTAAVSGSVSRPASHNSFCNTRDTTYIFAHNSAGLCNGLESTEALHFGATNPGLSRVQSLGSSVSHSFACAMAAPLSRGRTPPVGNRACSVEKNIIGLNSPSSLSSSMTELADIAASLSGLNLSKNQPSHEDCLVQSQIPIRFDKPNHLLDMSNGHKQNKGGGSHFHPWVYGVLTSKHIFLSQLTESIQSEAP